MRRALALLVLSGMLLAARAQAQTEMPDTLDTRTHPVRTLGTITLVNGLVWSYDRYIRAGGGSGFRIGWNSCFCFPVPRRNFLSSTLQW